MKGKALLWTLIAVLTLVVAFMLLVLPQLEQRLAPQPRQAWVAIEVAESGVADVGVVNFTSDTPFRLHAVLEADAGDGTKVYFTEAQRLRIGGQEVDESSLRPFDLGGFARPLWFTIEGSVPYWKMKPGQELDRFKLEAFFRPEWGRVWSLQGSLDSVNDNQLEEPAFNGDRSFGTQRYQVWIEWFETESALVAKERYPSWGAEEVFDRAAEFPTAVVSLPGRAAPVSKAFGLTLVEPPAEADAELLERLSRRASQGLLCTRLTLLRDQIRAFEQPLEALAWRRIDLGSGPAWGDRGAREGDLLRVGSRMVVLFEDAGEPGVVDGGDLCFDFDRGVAIRALSSVFVGQGEVEWAALGRDPEAP